MTQDDDTRRLDLCEAADMLLNECRMVLPGIQALFGFQLVAVFSPPFADLEPALKQLHLLATALVVVAIALVMTPAAYHRQAAARRPVTIATDVACTLPCAKSKPAHEETPG